MQSEHLVMIIVAIITGVFGWAGNYITNLFKRDEMSMNRINLIIVEYEKSLERCNERGTVLTKENRVLTERNHALEKENAELREKLKGGDR